MNEASRVRISPRAKPLELADAISDLRWLYHQSESAMGLRAQSYDAGYGGLADYDAPLLNTWHRDAVEKEARIRRVLVLLDRRSTLTLERGFQVVPWPTALKEAFRFRVDITLVGVALASAELDEAHRSHRAERLRRWRAAVAVKGEDAAPPLPEPESLLEFLTWEAGMYNKKILQPIRDASTEAFTGALSAYARAKEADRAA